MKVSVALAAFAMMGFVGPVRAQKMEAPPDDGADVTPNIQLNNDQLAARFLDQATLGATPEEVATLSEALKANPNTAFADWINNQFAKPVQDQDLSLPIFRASVDNKTSKTSYHLNPHMASAIRGGLMISDNNNELRRMVANALSQTFVVSDQDNAQLNGAPEGLCDWNDMLYRNAFTDFYTILHDVTYHPYMGDFLSSCGNSKAGFYNKDSRPDENYAREVMQLFTIGLVQLNLDGSMVADNQGHAIPTYTQAEIPEVARVFTGLWYPEVMVVKPGKDTPEKARVRYGTDEIIEKRHDQGAKTFLGHTLPAARDTRADIDGTLHILCEHPNCAPFFARAMIQRMVSSNPSPAYIKRVAQAFVDSKGDMKTVISAILLDEEARNPAYAQQEVYGKLREPWLRITELARAFHAVPSGKYPAYPVESWIYLQATGEFPLSPPSVFNFYLPTYQPPGVISDRNLNANETATLLVAPEFQILNSNTALLTPNHLLSLINYEPPKSHPDRKLFPLDLTPQINLAKDPVALVDNISTLLTGGTMSQATRDTITQTLSKMMPDNDPNVLKERARTAVYLTMISPDYAVQK